MNRYSGILFTLLMTICSSVIPNQEPDSSSAALLPDPVIQVENLHNSLIMVMKSKREYGERETFLTPVIENLFDTDTISRIALGSHWKTLAEADRILVTSRMLRLIISNYASRFKQFSGEEFATVSNKRISANRHLVKATLKTSRGETITLDYFLLESDSGWKIYDITANGVSDLALKRASYNESYRESGLAGVISEIDRQIGENKSSR